MREEEVKKKMQEVLDLVASDVASIRTGKANSSLVDDVEVIVYGGQQKMRVNELGTITTPDTQTIVIEPWDKSIIGEIRKGLMSANLGLNPAIDGEIIRISLPPMTTEDRENYVKLLNTKIENGKIMIRQIRGDAMRDIKEGFENKDLSEDEKFAQEKRLQEITDDYTDKIEEIGDNKKQELLKV
jgi:ribosome recycling factor